MKRMFVFLTLCFIGLTVVLSIVGCNDNIWGFIRFFARILATLSVIAEFAMFCMAISMYMKEKDLTKMTPEEFQEAKSEVEFQLEDHLVSMIIIPLLVFLAGLYIMVPNATVVPYDIIVTRSQVKPLWLGLLLDVHGTFAVLFGGLALLFFGGGTLLATIQFLFDKYFDQ